MRRASYTVLVALVGISGLTLGCSKSGGEATDTTETKSAHEPSTSRMVRGAPKPGKGYIVPIPENAPTKGSPTAKVIIQEFSDFQCPFCVPVNPLLAQVLEEYGDRVRVVWRNYPLASHKNAHVAAEASLEVHAQKGNEAFWRYHDILFANQNALSRENLEQYAAKLGGIDMAAFRAALDSGKHKAAVDADMNDLVESGISQIGTPTFFVNHRLIQGAVHYGSFSSAIEAELNE
jgi:protein-disulfide isomerase